MLCSRGSRPGPNNNYGKANNDAYEHRKGEYAHESGHREGRESAGKNKAVRAHFVGDAFHVYLLPSDSLFTAKSQYSA